MRSSLCCTPSSHPCRCCWGSPAQSGLRELSQCVRACAKMAVGSPAEPSTRPRGAQGLRALLYVSLESYALPLSRTRSSTHEARPLAQRGWLAWSSGVSVVHRGSGCSNTVLSGMAAGTMKAVSETPHPRQHGCPTGCATRLGGRRFSCFVWHLPNPRNPG